MLDSFENFITSWRNSTTFSQRWQNHWDPNCSALHSPIMHRGKKLMETMVFRIFWNRIKVRLPFIITHFWLQTTHVLSNQISLSVNFHKWRLIRKIWKETPWFNVCKRNDIPSSISNLSTNQYFNYTACS